MPDIYDHITVGFNSTVRRLEALAIGQKPPLLPPANNQNQPEGPHAPLSVVFVCRRSLPEMITSSLPFLITTSAPKYRRARLVGISLEAEARIAQALQQPRVGVLGVEEGAPGADTLLRIITETIDAVEVPWLEPGSIPSFLPVSIKTVEIGTKTKTRAQDLKRKRVDKG